MGKCNAARCNKMKTSCDLRKHELGFSAFCRLGDRDVCPSESANCFFYLSGVTTGEDSG